MTQSEQSRYMQLIASFPAMTAVAGLVASFPVPKIFMSNAIPLLHAINDLPEGEEEAGSATTTGSS